MTARGALTALAVLAASPALAQAPVAPSPAIYVVTYVEALPRARDFPGRLAIYAATAYSQVGREKVEVLREIGRDERFVLVERWADAQRLGDFRRSPASHETLAALERATRAPVDARDHTGVVAQPAGEAPASAVHIVTHLDVPPGSAKVLRQALTRYHSALRAAHGLIAAQVLQQTEPRGNHMTVLETWTDRAAADTHRASAPAVAFRRSLAPLLGALYDERLYLRVSPNPHLIEPPREVVGSSGLAGPPPRPSGCKNYHPHGVKPWTFHHSMLNFSLRGRARDVRQQVAHHASAETGN